jgi:hypothetical protein
MKKFAFPLARVLDWRRIEVRVAEAGLERLRAELREIEAHIEGVRSQQSGSRHAVLDAGRSTGAELAALDSFQKFGTRECARLEDSAASCRGRIAKQVGEVARRRRDARLLEKLEQRKLAAWTAGFELETQQQAEEAHLAKLARRTIA